MNNSTLRDELISFRNKVREIQRLKEELKKFQEDPDNNIPPGVYKIGNDLFVISYKNKSL